MITLQIYLIDKGTQHETNFGIIQVYEYPPQLLEFGVFSCICPVLIPSADELIMSYKSFVGYKCKCDVGKFQQEQHEYMGV